MITKSRTATKPKTAKQLARGERPREASAETARKVAAAREMPPLTDADREEALEALWRVKPSLCLDLQACKTLTQAALLVEQQLFWNAVPPWFYMEGAGVPGMSAMETGVVVRAAGGARIGTIDWDEIAEHARETDDPIDREEANANAGDPEEDDEAQEDDDSDVETDDDEEEAKVKPGARAAKGTGTTKAAAKKGPSAAPEFRESSVSLHQVELSPNNPRKEFNQAALEELAASIRSVGLIEPIVVRPIGPNRYELVAGERRLRACKLAGKHSVHVRVAEMTDEQADEIRLIENLQRQDLSAIEEANGFQQMIAQHGYTQQQLAARLGKSQGHVANRLALLKLGPKWRERIISGEMPSSHARALMKYSSEPALMGVIEEAILSKDSFAGIDPDFDDFREDVDRVAQNFTKPMTGKHRSSVSYKKVGIFKPTVEQREQLGIAMLDGKEVATNTKLWTELQTAHEKTLGAKSDGKKKGNGGAPGPTPAERKANEKKKAEQLNEWVGNWRADWLRTILSRMAVENRDLAMKTIVMGLAHGVRVHEQGDRVGELVEPRTPGLINERAIAADTVNGTTEVLVQLAADWLWDDYQAKRDPGSWNGRTLMGDAVEALAGFARVDLVKEWRSNLAGDLTQAFFNRHDKAALVTMADAFGVDVRGDGPKSEIIDCLITQSNTKRHLPNAIKPVASLAKKVGKKAKLKR
jgi:ParB/RepB/Spo0J family partition protein